MSVSAILLAKSVLSLLSPRMSWIRRNKLEPNLNGLDGWNPKHLSDQLGVHEMSSLVVAPLQFLRNESKDLSYCHHHATTARIQRNGLWTDEVSAILLLLESSQTWTHIGWWDDCHIHPFAIPRLFCSKNNITRTAWWGMQLMYMYGLPYEAGILQRKFLHIPRWEVYPDDDDNFALWSFE